MADYKETSVGIDVAKLRNAIAIAEAGRERKAQFFSEADASATSTWRVIERIAGRFNRVHFCYETGPTRYGLYPVIRWLGHECTVVAPSRIPRKPRDRAKANRRDAISLARLLQRRVNSTLGSGESHEAMRDMIRARPGPHHEALRRPRKTTIQRKINETQRSNAWPRSMYQPLSPQPDQLR